jgi:hypothetical protein
MSLRCLIGPLFIFVSNKESFSEIYWLILDDTTLSVDLNTRISLVIDFQTKMYVVHFRSSAHCIFSL